MTSTKSTNPKDAVGVAKVPYSTVPRGVIAELGLAMLEGALRYGRHNYRVTSVRASVYYDACMRHVDEWYEGQDIDKASGLHNITKAIACLTVLRDAMLQGTLNDDRPPGVPLHLDEMNAHAASLLKRFPNPKPACIRKKPKK